MGNASEMIIKNVDRTSTAKVKNRETSDAGMYLCTISEILIVRTF